MKLLNGNSNANKHSLNYHAIRKHFDELQLLIDQYEAELSEIDVFETSFSGDQTFEQLNFTDYKIGFSSNSIKGNGTATIVLQTSFSR